VKLKFIIYINFIMTRFTKTESGKYKIAGKMFELLVGTRAQVWHGTAYKTSGGLSKPNLMQNHAGRIVSKAKHATAKKEMRLLKHGYGTQKGKFGFVKLTGHRGRKSRHSRKTRGRGRRMRGGSGITSELSPHDFSADGNYPTSGVATQH
jgi:hypothetical protein